MRASKEFEIIHTVGKRVMSKNGIYKFKILSIDESTGHIFKETEANEIKAYLLVKHFNAINKAISNKDKSLLPLSLLYFAEDFVPFLNGVLGSKFKFKFVKKHNIEVVKPLLDIFEDEEAYFNDTFRLEIELDLYPMVANRCAVRIEPNKLFIDWLNFTDEDYIDSSIKVLMASTYLIRDVEEDHLMESWLKRNYSKIFDIQLKNYCNDESLWPQKRTYSVFNKWFNIGFSDMIIDLEKGPIEMM